MSPEEWLASQEPFGAPGTTKTDIEEGIRSDADVGVRKVGEKPKALSPEQWAAKQKPTHLRGTFGQMQYQGQPDVPVEDIGPFDVIWEAGERKIRPAFQSREQRPIDYQALAGKAEGGAVAGGIAGLAGPKILQGLGKVLPGFAGKGAELLGKAWEKAPTSARIAGGVGGGAVSGATEEVGAAFGLSPAATLATSMAAGGAGDSLASLTAKELSVAAKLIGSGLYHSPGGIVNNSLKLLTKPNREQFLKEAQDAQEREFGKRIKGYTEGVIPTTQQVAVKGNLMQKYGQQYNIPQNLDKPVSAHIRDDIIAPTVTKEISQGNAFSRSPFYGEIEKEVVRLQKAGTLSRPQVNEILGKLRNDTIPDPKTISEYNGTVDRIIRDFGKPLESGQFPSGHKALDAKDSLAIREMVRENYNKWLDSLGIGQAERSYRDAYRLESQAELRDQINHSLTYIDNKDAFDSLKPLMKDGTYTKGEVIQGIREYLANSNPEDVLKKFTKLDTKLVGSRLLTKEEMIPFENAAKKVQNITESGAKLRATQNFTRMLIKQLSYKAGAQIGVIGMGNSQ